MSISELTFGVAGGLLVTPALLLAGRRLQRTADAPLWTRGRTVTAALTAACGGAAAAVQPTTALIVLYALVFAVSTAASCTDLAEKRLPDKLTYPLIGAAGALILSSWWLGWPGSTAGGSIGGLVYGGWLLLSTLLVRAGYGLGDIKLATALGALTGTHSALAVAGAILAGQLLSIITMLAARARRQPAEVPLGPAITAGAALGLLYASTIAA